MEDGAIVDAYVCRAGLWTKKNEITWDMLRNTHGRPFTMCKAFKPRMRFDQAWLHGVEASAIRKFYIIGTKPLHGRHISDHFGIVLRVSLL
jgi:hypothetical protein